MLDGGALKAGNESSLSDFPRRHDGSLVIRTFSASRVTQFTWGVAPGYYTSRLWRCEISLSIIASGINGT
jgi:hypothetical protein